MVAAIHFAKIFGPLLLIMGIWCLFFRNKALEAANNLSANSAAMYIHGILNLIVGLTIVTFFNHWVWDATILVTILGWFLIVRGICALYWPECLVKCQMSSAGCIAFWGIIWIVWGFFLTWFGYFCKMAIEHTMMH